VSIVPVYVGPVAVMMFSVISGVGALASVLLISPPVTFAVP